MNDFQLPVVNKISEKVSPDLMIGEGSPDDNSNNASESEMVKINRSSDIIDDDTSTSSLINIANKQPPIQEHMEDSSSPHSSMSPADVAIADQKQQMEHVSHEHNKIIALIWLTDKIHDNFFLFYPILLFCLSEVV